MSPLSICTCAVVLAASILICAPADCQASSETGARGGVLSFSGTEVLEALAEIEQHFGVKIVPYGKLDSKVTATLHNADIAQALTSVTSPFGYRWRKVTLAVKEGEEVSAAKLRGIVTALEKLDTAAATVDNPIENTKLAFKRNPGDADELVEQTPPAGAAYETYYFVYNPKPNIVFAPAQPPKGQAPPGQSPTTMEGLVDWFAQLDHETQGQLIGQLMSSMMVEGMGGAVSLTIGVGEGDTPGEHNAVFIRKLDVVHEGDE